jgi:hypothetical protein
MNSQSYRDLRELSSISNGNNNSTSMSKGIDLSTSEFFNPVINKKSKNMQRSDSVGNILY